MANNRRNSHSSADNKVLIIENGGNRIINALIDNMRPNHETAKQRIAGKTYCIFLKGLDKSVKQSKKKFIHFVKRRFHGVKYIHIENKFGKIYFFTKSHCNDALNSTSFKYQNLTITMEPFRVVRRERVQINNEEHKNETENADDMDLTDVFENTIHNSATQRYLKSRIVVPSKRASTVIPNLTIRTKNKN